MAAFDPFTDAAIADPYPQYARLRAEEPVHWSEKLRAWVLFRHDDVAAVLRDDARFSADRRRPRAGRADDVWGAAIRTLTSDPPACLAPRAILMAALVPRVRALAPRLETIVGEQLDGLTARPAADLVADFAHPLPIRVIAELLDIPAADRPRFQALSAAVARGMDRFYGADDVVQGLRDIGAYFVGLVAERRTRDGDDLIHALAVAEHRGERLTDLEVTALCTALVFGGHETTVTLVSRGLLALLRHPAELARLRSDPTLVPAAVEELLRYESPPQFVSRTVREPCALRGAALGAGDTVLLGIGAANRDPAAFADAERLDVGRTPNPHLAFGLGTHVCPGAQLARLEARAAIPAILARFPRLRLAGEPVWRRTVILRALERLPVGLD